MVVIIFLQDIEGKSPGLAVGQPAVIGNDDLDIQLVGKLVLQFGQARMRGRGWPLRLAGALACPLVPWILLAKVARRVWRSGRDLAPFLASLPVLGLFAAAWALGEAEGYLSRGSRAT